MEAHLTLIRGLPGSGKTTLAKSLLGVYTAHFEADMFFLNDKHEYVFDQKRIREAHEWCQECTKACLSAGQDVIVSNTFTQWWEMQPYFNMFYTSLQVITCHGKFKNIHNVPDAVIEKMAARWQEYRP